MILEQLLNPENFDCFVLEVFSWENDWDHHEHNLFFYDCVEDLKVAIKVLDELIKGSKEIKHLNEDDRDLALDLVGGYQYESNYPRVADSYKVARLDSHGVLQKIEKIS